MIEQLAIGSVIIFSSLCGGAVIWWWLNELLERMEPWLKNPTYPLKFFVMILMVVLSTMTVMTFGVWLWAFVFVKLSVFGSLEEAVYFSLVAFTTLGLGDDTIIPKNERLLGGMAAANGFLMFGLMTAMLTDTLRHIRNVQRTPKDGVVT